LVLRGDTAVAGECGQAMQGAPDDLGDQVEVAGARWEGSGERVEAGAQGLRGVV